MMVYRALPYLMLAAPALIVLLTFLIGGCTMTRTADDWVDHPRSYSDPVFRPAKGLIK